MGCCESNEESGNVQMGTVVGVKAVGHASDCKDTYKVDIYESDADTQDAEFDLYSQFSEQSQGEGDSEDENTDWEDLENDVTLQRRGYAKDMFSKRAYKTMQRFVSLPVKDTFAQNGPFKTKPADQPEEYSADGLEFR